MYANEETIQAIIDETLLRIPDKDEHKQFWKNTCIDITNFENKSIENLEPGAYIHYGALDSVYDLFPTESFSVKRNPETVAILTSCEMFVLEVDRRYKQLKYQLSGGGYVEFTDFACKLYVYNATDIDGSTGNFSKQFDLLWRSSWSSDGEGVSGVKTTIPWYNQNEFFKKYVNGEYVSTLFEYDSIVHKKGSSEYVYSFPEKTGTIALSENIPTKLSDLTNDTGYITIGSVGNGILTITQNGTNKGTFSANQSSNSTVDITVPTKVSELTNDSGYTTNTGTVTQVKVGSTAYNPSSGIVSLPAYPTTLPASDVYAWAKASTKPSYSYSEISGTPTIPTSANYLERGGWWAETSSLNVDNLRDGIHFVFSSHGAPTTGTLVTFSGEGSSSNYCWQMILDYHEDSLLYIRNRNGNSPGTWGDWRRIARADEIPTSLPASDVYAWAKASTKPSYTASEVGALPLSGGTMTGTINTPENNVALNFRPDHAAYSTTISYQNFGNEALVFATKMLVTSFIFVNGEDSIANHESYRWQSLTPGLQIKNNKVAIGKLIADGVTPTYALDVNGTVNATSFEGSGASLTGVNADALQNSTPDESAGASTIVKRTAAGQVRAVYYNMSGDADNINSFTSNVAFVSSDGWIRQTSKANFSTWLLTWTKLGSTTGNTVLTYTGTYTEFFVVLDLGFYAETFYFVASALGGNRHFFGGTTNTSDGSSWVLCASRSNSTYSFNADRVHQDGTDYTSQVNVSVYAR